MRKSSSGRDAIARWTLVPPSSYRPRASERDGGLRHAGDADGRDGWHRTGAGGGARRPRRRGDRPHPQPRRAAARLPQGVTAVGWDPVAGARPGRRARRPRRGRQPRGRERRAALDLRGQAAHPRVARARHPQPRRGPAERRAAARSARLRVRVGYYGAHGDERVGEDAPAGDDFLAAVSVAWEREALEAEGLGMRVAIVRTGIVLDADSGALATMLTPFKLGVGGPVAGGGQYMPWIDRDDEIGLLLAALDNPAGSPGRSTARRPSPRRTATSRARSGGRCTAPRSPRSPPPPSSSSTATWPRSS